MNKKDPPSWLAILYTVSQNLSLGSPNIDPGPMAGPMDKAAPSEGGKLDLMTPRRVVVDHLIALGLRRFVSWIVLFTYYLLWPINAGVKQPTRIFSTAQEKCAVDFGLSSATCRAQTQGKQTV